MDSDKLMHDMIVERLKARLSRDYKEINVNEGGCPDITLANHGITTALVEVETEKSITPEKAGKWKQMLQAGPRLILIVPRNEKVKTTELLWKSGIADRVSIGSYEITITMP